MTQNNDTDDNKINNALERVLSFATQHAGAFENYDTYTRNEADKIILRQWVLDTANPPQSPNRAVLDAAKIVREGYDWQTSECPKEYRDAISLVLAHAEQADEVKIENNINLLCHECGKNHEHEYNQPPRSGSCEVCGRGNMLCTRVMTEQAREHLKRQKGR